MHNEYVEGNLKIPLSILYKLPNYNLNILERVKYDAIEQLFFNTLKSKHGYVFDNLIQSTNDENFNNNLSSIKTSVLKNSIEHPIYRKSILYVIVCCIKIFDIYLYRKSFNTW